MDSPSPSIPLAELIGHAAWARSLARSLVSDAARADDLAQDALVTALEAPPRHAENLRGWLASVMRRRARAQSRRERVRAGVEAEARTPAEATAPDAAAAEGEQRRRLAALVQALEEPYRSTLLMRYWHGLEPGEIARRLGTPAGTVRWRLKVALERLREDLDRDERGGRRAWVLALLPLASRDSAPAAATAVPGIVALAATAAATVALVVVWRVAGEASSASNATLAAQPAALAPVVDGPSPGSGPTRAPAEAPARTNAAALAAVAPSQGLRVEARAVDASGRPVAGARLALARSSAGPGVSAAGGADGRVTLELPVDGPVPTRALAFVLRAPGRAALVLEGAPADGLIQLGQVALDPGGTLVGRVLDAQGEALPHAWVQARAEHDPWGDEERLGFLRSRGRPATRLFPRGAVADERGHFELEGLGLGAWRIAAGARDAWPVLGPVVRVEAGVEREVEALRVEPLPPERCLRGRVLDGQDRPVAGARVQFEGRGALGATSFSERCDDQGAFVVVFPAGIEVADLTAHDPLRSGRLARRAAVEVGSHGLELRLAEPETMRVRVLARGPDGFPARGWSARALRAEDSGSNALDPGVETHPDGSRTLALPRVRFELEFTAPGMQSRRVGPFEPDALPERIEVDLAPELGLRGRVTAGGEPAVGARVSVWRQTTGTSRLGDFDVRVTPQPLLEAEVDGDGAFELQVPAGNGGRDVRTGRSSSGFGGYGEMPAHLLQGRDMPRRVYVRVELDGFAPLEVGPLDPERNGEFDVGELALTLGGTLEGRVLSGDGVDVAGARVVASRGDARPREQVVGDDGRFRFEHLTPGPWEVRLVEPSALATASVSFSSFSGAEDAGPSEIPSNCTVEEGGTTSFELVRVAVPSELNQSVFLDGRIPVGAPVWWSPADEALDAAVPEDAARVEASSVARLRREQPGEARLALELEGLDLRLYGERRLLRGEQTDTLGLASATLDVLGAPTDDLWLVCVTKGAWGLRRIEGELRGLRVPSGSARAVRFAPGEVPGRAGGTTLVEVQVPPGGRAELRLP